jgi:perosamine synthetase
LNDDEGWRADSSADAPSATSAKLMARWCNSGRDDHDKRVNRVSAPMLRCLPRPASAAPGRRSRRQRTNILAPLRMVQMNSSVADQQKEMPLMEPGPDRVVLFHPFVPPSAKTEILDTLDTRWVGQGPKVKRFEELFSEVEAMGKPAVAVGSGTDALHLAYRLCGIDEGDEVIVPVFTCTATNIPLLYQRARLRFVDVEPGSLNIDVSAIEGLINERTKAIVVVHYGGLPCDLDALSRIERDYGIPVIQDGAHALGMRWRGMPMARWSQLTMYSFQAIKHITTGDGGMLVLNSSDDELLKAAQRIRWFGIDREKKQGGIWENDIVEIGYKYQMTDLGASLGLAGLRELDKVLRHRRQVLSTYERCLKNIPGITYFSGAVSSEGGTYAHAAWLCTILVQGRRELQRKLYERGIETNQVHYRNDRYSIFRDHVQGCEFPNMDRIEDDYLVLPLHHMVSVEDAERICDCIRQGW